MPGGERLELLYRRGLIRPPTSVGVHPRFSLAALKTLQPALANDADQCAALLGEEWLAGRVVSHYFPQVVPLAAGERSCLYYVMSYHEGATLQQRLDHGEHFSVSAAVRIGIRLLKGLAALHRLNIKR